MSDVLRRIQGKIEWANQHIHNLQLAISAFNAGNPYAVAIKEDTESGERLYYLTKADPIPEALARITADVIVNLLPPLDQIVYQLVLAGNGGQQPKGNFSFPIRNTAAEYPSAIGAIKKYVRPEVVDAINTTEPWKGGLGHTLWQLNALNNPEKHRLPVLTASFYRADITPDFANAFRQVGLGHYLQFMPRVFITPLLAAPLKAGDKLFTQPLTEMQEDRKFSFEIALNEPGIVEREPVLKTLQEMSEVVSAVVSELGGFLP